MVLLLLCPILICVVYPINAYGANRKYWYAYRTSHSNPAFPFRYKPKEARAALKAKFRKETYTSSDAGQDAENEKPDKV